MTRINDGSYWISAGSGESGTGRNRFRYPIRYKEEKVNQSGPVKIIMKDGKRLDALTAGQSGN